MFRVLAEARNDTEPRGKGYKRVVLPLVGLVLAACLAVTAAADNPSGSGWNIGDGTIPDPAATSFLDPVGSVKELGPLNGASTKIGVIDTAAPPMLDFTDINPGNDLASMSLGTSVAPDGHIWLYFAWAREAASTGFIGFEFQKSKQPQACNYNGLSQIQQNPLTPAQSAFIANCNPWANRATGDFMIVWDQVGQNIDLLKRTFTQGSGFSAAAAVGSSDFAAAQTPDGLKGEAAIDLTAEGFLPNANDPNAQCLTFANVIASTITGNSDTADFKDTILADTSGVGISNCGKLTLIKNVVNDNGGAAGPGSWTLSAAGSSRSFSGAGGSPAIVSQDVTAGVQYTLSESGSVPGYLNGTSWDCSGGHFTGPNKIAVDAATSASCTITNDDVAPQLTVIKHVVNNNGGTKAASDFTMNVTGANVSQSSFAGAESPGTTVTLNAGSYSVDEGAHDGYAKTLSADCSGSIALGEHKTCTITNDDQPGTLVVKKVVINDNGGTKKATDFSFKLDGGSATSFQQDGADPLAGKNTLTVAAGSHSVVEANTPIAGYTTTYSNCDSVSVANGATQTCTITNDDHTPGIAVTKSASPTQVQDSGLVTFKAVVTNTSQVSPGQSKDGTLTIDSLSDSIYGNLITGPTKATCTFGGTIVSLPYQLPAGESLVCTFQATVSQTETDTVTSSGTDVDGKSVTAQANATVTVAHTPPPPPSAPKTDIAITKAATAQVTLGSNGKAAIAYDIRIQNNGPDPAANVTVNDPAPSGVVFDSVAQQPSQGSCSIQSSGALLSCVVGTLAAGQSVAVRVNATVSVTGTITNTGTTTTDTPDTNPSNNTASAQTLVVAPVTPPTPKPKPEPKPAPEICNTVDVTPKMVKANGKTQTIRVSVTKGGSKKGVTGASVQITGPGINKKMTVGKNGKAVVTVKPSKPGIIRVEVRNAKACNTQRIGVVGVYEPPVTG
jgi:uncharacterized repeat protein (TIGR01451 family)